MDQLFTAPLRMTRGQSFQRAQAAAYIMRYLLIEEGYFIGLDKLQSTPSTWVRFLGFVCDSVRQAFLIPQERRIKFATLREDILSSPFVSLKTLQRFSGKVISFSLAIPGCKLYVREVFNAISRHSGSSRPTVKLEANLRAEIEFWRFLDDWKDCFQWRTERQASVTVYFDASKMAWGGTLRLGGHSLESRDTGWTIRRISTSSIEAQALLYLLLSFKKHLTSSRVDVYTDNRVLTSALENGCCRSSEVNGILKDIFRFCREYNFSLDVYYVPSGENPADTPFP